jgi:hypothetical protein
MNRQQFMQFIQAPDKLNADSISELNGVINTFPYFQTAHLLYLKALHNQNSIHYNSRLKLTAAYATDRKVLYDLITGKQVIKSAVTADIVPPPEENIPVREEIVKTAPVTEESVTAEVLLPEKEEETLAAEAKETRLNTDILAEIINTTAIHDIAELPLQGGIPEEKEEKIPVKLSGMEGTRSFSEWLHLSKGETSAAGQGNSQQDSLISKFITTDPRMKVKKVEFYSPVNMARQSVKEDLSFVTETLAKVYMQQGNLVKAKQAFENLSLKYPEKSLYFAAQIKIINEQLNSKK